jgi:hypothetical protein
LTKIIEFRTIEYTNNPILLTYERAGDSLADSISNFGGVNLFILSGNGFRHDSQAKSILGLTRTVSEGSSSNVSRPDPEDKAMIPFPLTK